MPDVRYTPRAEQDLRAIWRTIAADSPRAADRMLIRLMEKAELAATQPGMGSPRPALSPTARVLVEGNYIMIYEPAEPGIVVVAIVHGAMRPDNWLR